MDVPELVAFSICSIHTQMLNLSLARVGARGKLKPLKLCPSELSFQLKNRRVPQAAPGRAVSGFCVEEGSRRSGQERPQGATGILADP